MPRDYENTPRPEIENHYHIRELIERQEKRTDDRNYHRNKGKLAEERNDLIKDAEPYGQKEFYCEPCKEDFLAHAIKEVETDWSCLTQSIAFYRTKHWCGTWCMRLVTDRHRDSYWFKSLKVARDRGKHSLDTIQPHETNFQLLYGKR